MFHFAPFWGARDTPSPPFGSLLACLGVPLASILLAVSPEKSHRTGLGFLGLSGLVLWEVCSVKMSTALTRDAQNDQFAYGIFG